MTNYATVQGNIAPATTLLHLQIMARSRRKGKGTPNGKANAKHNSHGRHNARSNATPQSVKSHATAFSLADEAKWASSHRSSAFSADKKLRSLQIEFVSAGLLEGTLKVQETVVETATVPESSPDSSPTAATAMRKMAIRSPSPLATPSDSSSSEDEIVFKGRANMVSAQVSASSQTAPSSVTNKPTPPLPQKPLPKVVPKATATVNKKAAPPSSVPPHRRAKASTSKASGASAEESDHAASDEEDINAVEFLKRSGLESPWMSNTMPWESRSKPGVGWLPLDARPDMRRVFNGDADEADSKAAAEDDYMQNIREELLGAGSAGPTSFARRDLDLDAGDSDDHFVAADSEESDGDEDSQASRDSEDDDDDESSEDDDELTDAQLAKVLQKQEELGLGSDEVLLYGGDEIFDDSDVEELPVNRPDRPSKRRQMRIRGGKRGQKTFPSASLMADVLEADPYNGFDIMDTDRPSLRPMKKGRRGQMPPELSDSDLNEQLQSAWAADRAKKRLKKAEREDLRKQGLLGRKGKAPDLSKRYEDGISMNDVVEEIREWFFSEIQR